jgi:hypothetical protein
MPRRISAAENANRCSTLRCVNQIEPPTAMGSRYAGGATAGRKTSAA